MLKGNSLLARVEAGCNSLMPRAVKYSGLSPKPENICKNVLDLYQIKKRCIKMINVCTFDDRVEIFFFLLLYVNENIFSISVT